MCICIPRQLIGMLILASERQTRKQVILGNQYVTGCLGSRLYHLYYPKFDHHLQNEHHAILEVT